MVTRVQLDASHVCRGVTVRREKVLRYIRNSNELLRYVRLEHFFTLLRTLEYAERILARFLEFSFSLLVFGDSVTYLSVGARSAAATPFCVFVFFRFSRGFETWRSKASMVRS